MTFGFVIVLLVPVVQFLSMPKLKTYMKVTFLNGHEI